MLSNDEFLDWCDRLQYPDKVRKYITQIRSSDPSRSVDGGRKSVSGKFPSRKMGVGIQFESHKVELPFIYELEHDREVLEYYDQPPQIKLLYQLANGRNSGHFYTPDFFVIRVDSAGWFECKHEEDLQRLFEKNPNRYFLDEDGTWRMPPGEQFAKELGLFFQVWSSADINWTLQRNLEFLQNYYV